MLKPVVGVSKVQGLLGKMCCGPAVQLVRRSSMEAAVRLQGLGASGSSNPTTQNPKLRQWTIQRAVEAHPRNGLEGHQKAKLSLKGFRV